MTILGAATGGVRPWQAVAFLLGIGAPTLLNALPPSTTGFYSVTPCRLADTRGPSGPWGGPALAANSSRTFQVTGRCGIPSTAEAAVLNVTVAGATSSGSLRIYPADYALPNASAINYRHLTARANNGSYALNSSGGLSIRCDQPSGTAHVCWTYPAISRPSHCRRTDADANAAPTGGGRTPGRPTSVARLQVSIRRSRGHRRG